MADPKYLKPENFDEPNGSWLLRELEGVIDAIERLLERIAALDKERLQAAGDSERG